MTTVENEMTVVMKDKDLKNQLSEWEAATNKMVEAWLAHHFPYADLRDYHWVCDCIGDVLCFGAYFFNVEFIVDSIRYGATFDQIDEYYWAELDEMMEGRKMPVNFKNFIEYGWPDSWAAKKGVTHD